MPYRHACFNEMVFPPTCRYFVHLHQLSSNSQVGPTMCVRSFKSCTHLVLLVGSCASYSSLADLVLSLQSFPGHFESVLSI